MTGFASATRELSTAAINVELRSVNHRYLDLQFRLPEELRALEAGLREIVVGKLQRGKVECRIGLNPLPAAQKSAELNVEVLKQLRALSEKLRLACAFCAGCRRLSGSRASLTKARAVISSACRYRCRRAILARNRSRL